MLADQAKAVAERLAAQAAAVKAQKSELKVRSEQYETQIQELEDSKGELELAAAGEVRAARPRPRPADRSPRVVRLRRSTRSPSASSDADGHELHRIVRVAADVPRRLERLLVPGGVARAAREDVLARLRVPDVGPPSPRPAAESNRRRAARASTSCRRRPRSRPPRSARAQTTRGPRSSREPASTVRLRVMNSGMPGGTISARGRIRCSGTPGSSSSARKW